MTDEDYEHATIVFQKFNCETIADYTKLYVSLDTTLLADVFEEYRKLCLSKFSLDPAHFVSAPSLTFKVKQYIIIYVEN